MRLTGLLTTFVAVTLILAAASAMADVPSMINYQGLLTDQSTGDPLPGPVNIVFSLYSQVTGSGPDDPLWTEPHNGVVLNDGLFDVQLGGLDETLFSEPTRWLQITVGGEDITPRVQMVCVPYAFHSSVSDSSEAADVAYTIECDGCITQLQLATNSVHADELAPDAVASQNIQNGTIQFEDIGPNSATSGQVMKRVGGVWVADDDEIGSGGGWVDDGTNVRLETQSDNVGIGTSSPVEKLDVDGNIHASGTLRSGNSITIDGINETITATGGVIDFDDDDIVTTGKVSIGPGSTNVGTDAFAAGSNSTASGDYSSVSGGRNNIASGTDAFVGGGTSDTASGGASTVCGGANGHASGDWSTVGGGAENKASGAVSTISGGARNRARGLYSVVAGGGGATDADSNSANGDWSVVGGGLSNSVAAASGTISGGNSNEILGGSDASTIAGGQENVISNSAIHGTISGGWSNSVSANKATIGGGSGNDASHQFCTIGGGLDNTASDYRATVGGGWENTASGENATVGGGHNNSAVADYATVAGGHQNDADSSYCTVSGGVSNKARATWSTVGGGVNNLAGGTAATVAGGDVNVANGNLSTIAGGASNESSALLSTVGGGIANRAEGEYSTVSGGDGNIASGNWSTIGGGKSNGGIDYSGNYSTISGGQENRAGGDWSAVAGGYSCNASGNYSFTYGNNGSAKGDYSFAGGNNASALHDGAFVFADASSKEPLESSAPNQFMIRAAGGTKVYSDSKLSSGVTIHPGSSAWAVSSDRNLKENFSEVDGNQLLEKLAQLPITEWNYKSQDGNVRHIGPVAQDFYALFGLGDDDVTISTIDPAGVALAAIQELHKKNTALEAEVTELKALVQKLLAERQ